MVFLGLLLGVVGGLIVSGLVKSSFGRLTHGGFGRGERIDGGQGESGGRARRSVTARSPFGSITGLFRHGGVFHLLGKFLFLLVS